jgi:SsrA-binding protein
MAEQRKKIEYFNKKARHDYQIVESLEAGIVLTGEEIKAVRSGRISLVGSYAKVVKGEGFWVGGMINVDGGDPQRSRKLLLHKQEINRLIGKGQEQGITLIPLKLYLKRGKAKLELGIGRGLKKFDKRQKLKEEEHNREIDRSAKL